jgi:hypothetical protein
MTVVRRPKHQRATTSCPAVSEPAAPPLRQQVAEAFREHNAKVWTDDDLVGVRKGHAA